MACAQNGGGRADFRSVLRASCGKIGLWKAEGLEALLLRADSGDTPGLRAVRSTNEIDNFADNLTMGVPLDLLNIDAFSA